MRNLIIFALTLIALATAALAQAPDTAWTRVINGAEYVAAVTASPEGDVITTGIRMGYATWRRWNAAGSCIDSNLAVTGYAAGSISDLWASAPCVDGSGDYILGGRTRDYQQPGSPYVPLAVRVNSGGDLVWQHPYAVPSWGPYGIVSNVVPRADGSAILFGGIAASYQAIAMAIDASGNVEWCNQYPVYGSANSSSGICIVGMPDGGAVIAGVNELSHDTNTVRIDATGGIVWANSTQFSRSALLHPDTILCSARYQNTLHTFKMTGSGDTALVEARLNRSCLQLLAEANGGWSILGSDSSGYDWIGRFNADGTMAWSGHYPVYMLTGVRLGHADYALIDLINRKVLKTLSGPRGDPTNLTILPGWPDPNLALLSWRGAEWQFYQIAGSATADGPFDQWIGGTSDTRFVVGLDSAAQFFRVVGVEQLE